MNAKLGKKFIQCLGIGFLSFTNVGWFTKEHQVTAEAQRIILTTSDMGYLCSLRASAVTLAL